MKLYWAIKKYCSKICNNFILISKIFSYYRVEFWGRSSQLSMGVSTNSSSKNFVKIQSKHPCWSLFWVRLQPSVCNFTEQNSEVDFFFEILWKFSDVQQKNSSTCIHIVHTCRDTFKSVHHFFYFRKIWCVFYVTESSP